MVSIHARLSLINCVISKPNKPKHFGSIIINGMKNRPLLADANKLARHG